MVEKLGQPVCNQFEEICVSLRQICGAPHVELCVATRATPGDGDPPPREQVIVLRADLFPALLRVMRQAQDLLLTRGLIPPTEDKTTELGEPILGRRAGIEFVDTSPKQRADLEGIREQLNVEEGPSVSLQGARVSTPPSQGTTDPQVRDDPHEAGEMLGKRRFARFPVSLPILARGLQASGGGIHGMARNIGGGGLVADFPVEIVPGSTVCIVLQARQGSLEVEGRVVWTAATEGTIRHGLVFLEPKGQEFAVDLFIHENRKEGAGAPLSSAGDSGS